MSLDLQQQQKLGWILAKASLAGPGVLSAWDAAFIAEMTSRYARFGERVKISEKQWAVLDKIHAKAG